MTEIILIGIIILAYPIASLITRFSILKHPATIKMSVLVSAINSVVIFALSMFFSLFMDYDMNCDVYLISMISISVLFACFSFFIMRLSSRRSHSDDDSGKGR